VAESTRTTLPTTNRNVFQKAASGTWCAVLESLR